MTSNGWTGKTLNCNRRDEEVNDLHWSGNIAMAYIISPEKRKGMNQSVEEKRQRNLMERECAGSLKAWYCSSRQSLAVWLRKRCRIGRAVWGYRDCRFLSISYPFSLSLYSALSLLQLASLYASIHAHSAQGWCDDERVKGRRCREGW